MRADNHNHTCHFSADAKMTIDELIDASVAASIDVVAVTEHYDYDLDDPEGNDFTFDIPSFIGSFEEWKSKCPSNLKLVKGIEIGYQYNIVDIIENVASSAPFDVVLLSNHIYHGKDVYYLGDGYKDTDKRVRHNEYINVMAEMCERCSNFDIAAHFDYINRYNPDKEEYLLYDDCPEAFDRFFEALISKEKCLEINTRSVNKALLKGSSKIMPDEKIIKRYCDMGGKLFSLGSDSHTPDTLGIYFDEMYEYLRSLGVRELCYYENRTPFTFGI